MKYFFISLKMSFLDLKLLVINVPVFCITAEGEGI